MMIECSRNRDRMLPEYALGRMLTEGGCLVLLAALSSGIGLFLLCVRWLER
jgi:hypothetical protein